MIFFKNCKFDVELNGIPSDRARTLTENLLASGILRISSFRSVRCPPEGIGNHSLLQLAPVDPEHVLPVRHKSNVTGFLPASPHLVPVRGELLISGSEVAQRLL
jgi:hypothetical protein